MGLSNNLISKFVKATKDEQEPNKETTVYGTVQKDQNGDLRVQLDGSDILTPVKSTVVLAENDRVTVMIKNHTATVTGNLTNPAASDGDTVRVYQLEAEKARVNDLVAANAKIQGTLEVQQGIIDELDSTYASIDYLNSNYLTANNIKTDYLSAEEISADYATISNVEATYATIANLNSVKGDIQTLNSEIANIDTLIFGSATGNVIQTSFSNSVIAQLGDAQIKSAMIENISASKISAGDIITNNVRVMSEDGSLVISDETLQISDGTNVRVQIGKDTDDDYSINIWDQNGNLMFSKGGITDSAIKEAIIRNDMVSDTANIHASKLDIDSLFEEINGSSNTIKSTQIYLDEEKQTLDVAFKTLTTEVTDQGETISSQGTAISTIQGQISSKIWQQDIDTATDEMSTQYSTLEQEVDSFKTTVSETYATVSDVEDIQIGGRNYIYDSANIVVTSLGSAEGSKGEYRAVSLGQSYMSIPAGTEVTVSFDLTMTVNTANPRLQVYNTNNKGPKSFPSHYFNFSAEADTIITQRCSFTTELLDRSEPTSSVNFMEFYTNYGTSNWFEITNLKMEIGNKATDWTPAPEDIDSEITNLDSRITSAESSITQLTNKITANVTETTNLGTRTTTLEQTAEDLSLRIDSQIDNASKTATNYLNFSSSGLVIGDLTSSTLGKNVLIDSDSVDIRNGTTTLASFGADYLYLAKNSRNAKIDLCNGLAQLYHQSKYSYDTLFIIDTPNATEIQGTYNPLCVTSTVSGKVSIQFANTSGVIGSIGMVESGTESYITRNHPSTAATYSILDTGNYYKLMDSGWIYGGSIGDGFSIYADDTQIQYRKIGKTVHIRGAVKPTQDISGSATSYDLFTLPSGYRPSVPVYARCQGSSANTWLLSITSAGVVRFSRYGYGNTYVTATAGTWLPFDVTFFID